MPSSIIGQRRSNVIYRILGLILYVTIGWIITVIASIAAGLWLIIDGVWGLVFNRRWRAGRATMWLERLFWWNIDIMAWIFFGDRPFPWTP